MDYATRALPSFQSNGLFMPHPEQNWRCFSILLEVAISLSSSWPIFLCLSVLVFLLYISVSKDLLLIIQLFSNKSFFANDKFCFKYLPLLLLGMPCMASAKGSTIVFQTVKEVHRYAGEAMSCNQMVFEQVRWVHAWQRLGEPLTKSL